MKKLYFLIGYPASGKTTLAKLMKEKLNCDYVSTDEIFNELCESGLKFSEILSSLNKETVMAIINKGMCGKNVVLDTYKPYEYERRPILSKIPETYEKIAVIMDTPVEECTKRFKKRSKLFVKTDISFADEIIDEPTVNEFDQIIRSSELYELLK